MVKVVDADSFDEHKSRRDEHKSTSCLITEILAYSLPSFRENQIHESPKTKVSCEENGCRKYVPFIALSHLLLTTCTVDGAAAAPAPKRQTVQMPDEYLPPNKILFLQNLPEGVTKDQLMALFSQYVFHHPTPTFRSRVPHIVDIQTCTKSVSSQQNETSRSWNIWTREALELRKTRYTITSWTVKTRSRFVTIVQIRNLSLILVFPDYICKEVTYFHRLLHTWGLLFSLYHIVMIVFFEDMRPPQLRSRSLSRLN